jgi:DnaK suppressor protein
MAHQALKHQLEKRLAALRVRLSSLKSHVIEPHSDDSAERAQERENDEVVDAIGNQTTVSIRAILAALERIENGTYGTCGNCGEAIGEARLMAMPEATRCLNCAH